MRTIYRVASYASIDLNRAAGGVAIGSATRACMVHDALGGPCNALHRPAARQQQLYNAAVALSGGHQKRRIAFAIISIWWGARLGKPPETD